MSSFFSNRIPRYFFLFFVIFFVTAFFAFYEMFRGYRAEAELLVLSKTPALPANVAARTIAVFPQTLAFYDRLLSDNDRIEDPWAEEAMPVRKDAWARVIDAEVPSETSLVRLSISSTSPEQASALLTASIETLYGFSGRLYDREREADIRLLEDVVTRPVFGSLWALLLMSVLLSGVSSFLVTPLFRTPFRSMSFLKFPLKNVPEFSQEQKESSATPAIQPVGNFSVESDANIRIAPELPTIASGEGERISETVPEELKREEPSSLQTVVEPSVSASDTPLAPLPEPIFSEPSWLPNEPEDIWERPRPALIETTRLRSSELSPEKNSIRSRQAVSSVSEKKSATPGALETIPAKDFTWEKYLFQNGISKDAGSNEMRVSGEGIASPMNLNSEVETPPEKREPTPEELKARLNQLLRGEM